MKPARPPEYARLPEEEPVVACELNHTLSASSGKQALLIRCIFFLTPLLLLSVVINIFLVLRSHESLGDFSRCESKYAHLSSYTIAREIYPSPEFVDDQNLTATRQAWEALSGDPGVVALTNGYVEEHHLPTAMRYPWDHSKGVYLLQGFHNLHCIRTIYRSIMDYHLHRPQKIALIHILHCLDELRQDVICHADDTPRYAGLQNPPGTGRGQIKMCRDWEALERWSLEHTACFRHEDEVADRMVNRFKFCPDGSRPWLEKDGVVQPRL